MRSEIWTLVTPHAAHKRGSMTVTAWHTKHYLAQGAGHPPSVSFRMIPNVLSVRKLRLGYKNARDSLTRWPQQLPWNLKLGRTPLVLGSWFALI